MYITNNIRGGQVCVLEQMQMEYIGQSRMKLTIIVLEKNEFGVRMVEFPSNFPCCF